MQEAGRAGTADLFAGMPPPAGFKPKNTANMKQAAVHCGVSEGTMRNYASRFPDMPWTRKGIGREGWEIDLDELDAWRDEKGLLNAKPRQLSTDTIRADAKASQRKANIQADLLQLQLDQKRGLLVEREAVVQQLSAAFAQFAKQLEIAPTLIGRKMGLDPAVIEALRKHLDDARTHLVRSCGGYLDAPAEPEAHAKRRRRKR